MKEIKPLTSMRGVFAIGVLAYHIEFMSGLPRGEPFMSYGYLGVEFFFLLSGFILASAYGQTFADKWELRSYLDYLKRRIRRIFPLHCVVLAVVAVSALLLGPRPQLWPLLGEFLLVHMWSIGVPRINGLDWSLSTELAANMVLPILAVLALRETKFGKALAIGTGMVTVAGLLISASDNGWSLNSNETPPAMVRCFCEFTIGILIYRWHGIVTFARSDTALSIIAVILLALVGMRCNDLIIAFVLAVGLLGLAGNTGRFKAYLSVRPLYYLGRISFSLYLVQQPVLWSLRWMVGDLPPASGRYWIFGFAALASTITVSHFTYTYIEARSRLPARHPTSMTGPPAQVTS